MFYCVFSILPVCTYSVYISPLFCNPASNILNCFCFWVHILPSYFLFDFFLSKVIMGLFTFFAILLYVFLFVMLYFYIFPFKLVNLHNFYILVRGLENLAVNFYCFGC